MYKLNFYSYFKLINAIILLGDLMNTVKKKRIKIKKKNFTIFLIILITIIFIVYSSTKLIINLITTPKEEIKKENKINNQQEEKLKKLENINEKIDYFNNDYIDRYIKYKEKNNIDIEQVIKEVNMNMDKEFYTDIKPSKNLNKETILVNKFYYLDKDYIPDNLEEIDTKYAQEGKKMVSYAKDAFEELSKAASKEKLNIIAMSAYRSYSYQVNLYNRYVNSDGKEAADTYSGRAGHSEHQTGLAVDVYNKKTLYTNFESTKEFTWMQQHAHEYGFILRFPKGKEKETGYQYESWHYRYVGKEIAKYIHDNNITLEEYYATKIKDW